MLILFVRFIFILAGAIGGAQLGEVARLPEPLSGSKIIAIILFMILGAGLGYVLGGIAGRQLAKAINWIEGKATLLPGTDLLIGAIGLFFGLVLATLVSIPLNAITIPIPLVKPVTVALVFVFLGYLSMRIFLAKKDELARIFHLGGHKPASAPLLSATQAPPVKILDTSVIIDGRITDIARTGFLEGRLTVPRFVLRELQTIADSEDALKRNRGRRGLDVLNTLQRESKIHVDVYDIDYPELADVDSKLVRLASESGGSVLTNDYNLNKVAELQGVAVLNINELANALKPVVLPGEEMSVEVLREGKEPGQGVGYLDDGTMVVVDGGKAAIGRVVKSVVTSVLQTPAGRMIFTKLKEG
ncbi:MAG: PIN/TRAM domain-containing protein [Actinobacteria bacterium]|nr:MAG: PIN/TRAM domain-containing protein [Actinomycetota bacterium]